MLESAANTKSVETSARVVASLQKPVFIPLVRNLVFELGSVFLHMTNWVNTESEASIFLFLCSHIYSCLNCTSLLPVFSSHYPAFTLRSSHYTSETHAAHVWPEPGLFSLTFDLSSDAFCLRLQSLCQHTLCLLSLCFSSSSSSSSLLNVSALTPVLYSQKHSGGSAVDCDEHNIRRRRRCISSKLTACVTDDIGWANSANQTLMSH